MKLICFFISMTLPTVIFANSDLSKCKTASDCILVQNSWCSRVQSVNKSHVKQWKLEDAKHTAEAQKNNQTCSPALGPELEIKNFKADCVSGSCQAKSNKS